jgi:hypothetical protein
MGWRKAAKRPGGLGLKKKRVIQIVGLLAIFAGFSITLIFDKPMIPEMLHWVLVIAFASLVFVGMRLLWGDWEPGKRPPRPHRKPTKPKIEPYTPYQKAATALTVAGCLCAVWWLFVAIPYRAFQALNLAFPVVAFLLYSVCFKSLQPMNREERAQLAMRSWLPSGFALFLRGVLDFNLDAPIHVVPPAAVLFLGGVVVFLAINIWEKPDPHRVICMFLCVAFYAVFASIHLNNLLDDGSRRETRQAVIVDMEIEWGDETPDMYVLHVDVQGNIQELQIPPVLYNTLKIGDHVSVETRIGPLGIAYSDAHPLM